MTTRLEEALGFAEHYQSLCKEKNDKIDQLRERVKELEELNLELAVNVEACCELTEMDMGAAIDRLFEIDNTEARGLVNKFALEQKIEALESLSEIGRVEEVYGGSLVIIHSDDLNERIEQLRKGGE